MMGISDKALKTSYAENKYRYNKGSELQNKEFSDGSGLEWYDCGHRMYDDQIGRFFVEDRLSDSSVLYSPYQYAKLNPVLNLDIMGDSAWSVKRDWNSSDVKGFADFAQKELKNYDGKNVDCADLALNILIDYANETGLSLQLSNKDGQTFDSNSDNYNSVDDYKNGYKDKNGERQGGVLPNMQASDISANTFTVNKKDAQPGDMIILTKPSNHIANYSQTQPERKLTYGNLRGGKPSAVSTTGDWSNATKDGRGNTMKYDPDNSHAHRWNVLNTTRPQPPTNPQ